MCVAPKIIIFTKKNKIRLSYQGTNFKNNTFYNFRGPIDTFPEIIEFLKEESKIRRLKNLDDVQLTFECIDDPKKLVLPLFFKTLIDSSNTNMDNYTSFLYDNYSKYETIKILLEPIKYISDIPMEILSKYYARLYTAESEFYSDLNRDLQLNKVDKYLPYIKTLYEGVKLKSLPLANDNILYRGSKISNDEITRIQYYINSKIQGLPSSIVFSKSFLSFSKDIDTARGFLKAENKNKNLSKVLFILEKEDKIEYNLSTHADIEKISFMPNEREVLFFPFSSFEIKDINEIKIGNEKGYQIKLLYLGKYLKGIEKDKNIIINENKIPDTEFKKQLIDVGLIEKEKVQQVNTKSLYNNYKQYETTINKIPKPNNILIIDHGINIIKNTNFITGEIDIKPGNINLYTRIINSFENFKREIGFEDREDDWKFGNEKEIKENIEIKINNIIIPFSYYLKFPKEGKYIIQYSFKKNLSKTNHMFWGCNLLTITNMSHMFGGCNSLKNLNLSNLNTQNVTNMSRMFYCCYLLTNLNLSTFNTQKVINMTEMFDGCDSLNGMNIIIKENKIIQEFNKKKWFNSKSIIYQ